MAFPAEIPVVSLGEHYLERTFEIRFKVDTSYLVESVNSIYTTCFCPKFINGHHFFQLGLTSSVDNGWKIVLRPTIRDRNFSLDAMLTMFICQPNGDRHVICEDSSFRYTRLRPASLYWNLNKTPGELLEADICGSLVFGIKLAYTNLTPEYEHPALSVTKVLKSKLVEATDFEVVCTDKSFYVNHVVMQELWDHFQAMMQSKMTEFQERRWLVSYTCRAMRTALEYFHTGALFFDDSEHAIELLEIGEMYNIAALQQEASAYLLHALLDSQILPLLVDACSQNSTILKRVCKNRVRMLVRRGTLASLEQIPGYEVLKAYEGALTVLAELCAHCGANATAV
ncbi:hypothetical protein HDE_12913 [Halotydeus destructor]|nr:hypothetical protein HDE_12913 [Halotydeus destructor]